MSKIIAHIDLNTFFVRCEELKNPSLIGKPVVIGRAGRGGIISTCSYEARKFGIKSGMPAYQAKLLCKDVIMIDGHFNDYTEKSNEFFGFIKSKSRLIEKASIDECFVDFTEVLKNNKDPIGYFKKLQEDLLKETGLKCSIGIAPTKFLAKMASDMKKPMGITVIRRKDVRKMLDPLPIGDFFGIGKKTAPKLIAKGINTIGDLAKLVNNEPEKAEKQLGSFYYVIKDWINGYGSDEISTQNFDPKSIGHSTTFYSDTDDIERIKDYLKILSKNVSDDAKHANKVGSSIQIVLKDTEFRSINRSKKIDKPTNDFEIIYKIACKLLEQHYDHKPLRLAGVTLQNLLYKSELHEQISIFDNFDEIKEECATQLLVAELNRKMKKSIFKTAGEHLKEMKNGNN